MCNEKSINLKFGNDLLLRLLNRFDKEQLRKPVYPNGSCVQWIVGHIASGRKSMIKMLDIQNGEEDWPEGFKRGSCGQYKNSWPEISLMKEYLKKSIDMICSKLEREGEILKEEAKHFLSEKKLTKSHNFQFLMFHEAYHIGQIGMAGNLFGHGPIVK